MVKTTHAVSIGLLLVLTVGGIFLLPGVLATPGFGHAQSADWPSAAGPPDEVTQNVAEENETIENVTGTLEATDGEEYLLNGLRIDIGAAWYVNSTDAPADFDGDGTVETIRAEFDGLVGQEVTLTVETDGEEGDVLAVNDERYRERGPPPWAGGPHD